MLLYNAGLSDLTLGRAYNGRRSSLVGLAVSLRWAKVCVSKPKTVGDGRGERVSAIRCSGRSSFF